MINAVIFDLDGLLIDSEIISYKIYKEILSPFDMILLLKNMLKILAEKQKLRMLQI